MPITRDQVRPGVKVRVLRNECDARIPGPCGELVPVGHILNLNGICNYFHFDIAAAYDMGEPGNHDYNWFPLADLELVESESDSVTEPATPDPISGPSGERELVVESAHSRADDRLAARIDALAASVAMLRVEIAAELAKLRTDVDAVRREMDYGKDDGK